MLEYWQYANAGEGIFIKSVSVQEGVLPLYIGHVESTRFGNLIYYLGYANFERV